MTSSKYSSLVLSFIGAILLWAAWPTSPFTILIFIAWLPMFFIAEKVKNWKIFFGYTYLMMLLWNLLTTWWVANSTVVGGISAFIANSLIMCIPWLLYFFTKKRLGNLWAGLAFIAYWIAYEYLHHNWDLSWPWLTLGNAFATHPGWVQWYEYTGTTGGSFWVLLANVVLFNAFYLYRYEGRSTNYFKNIIAFIFILFIPIVISFFLKRNLTLIHNKYNIVVVQPNIDPWDTKFAAGKEEAQIQKLISLSQKQIDANTALVVWPETAVPFQADENRLKEDFRLAPVWGFLKNNPNINLLTGIEGYKQFDHKESRYAKQFREGSGYYESYNSAALLDSFSIQIYHKSKLVPGAEILPWFLNFMARAFDKFGGITGAYARDNKAKVLHSTNNTFTVAPLICYESIYSDYMSDFTRQNANLICVITNDGWWSDTQGYKQHMNYARLRAIESRKWVARSANTGISCFIDPYGNIVQQLGWNTEGALKQDVAAFADKTFYSKHGDYLSKIFSVFAVLSLLIAIFKLFKK